MEGESITGQALQAIHAAMGEFEKTGLVLEKYRVTVYPYKSPSRDELSVLFRDLGRSEDADRSYEPKVIEYQVVLDPRTLKVLRAGMSR